MFRFINVVFVYTNFVILICIYKPYTKRNLKICKSKHIIHSKKPKKTSLVNF